MNKSFPKTYREVKKWITDNWQPIMSLDTETDGLHYGCGLKGVSLCDGENACYINLENNPDSEDILFELSTFLDELELLIGHNLSFDLRVLKYYGINYTGKIFDTMVAAHLLNENKSCALKDIAIRVLKVPKEEAIEFKDAVINGYSSEKFLNYAINDSIYTWQLYEKAKPLLTEQGLDKLFYGIEMPFQYVLVDLFTNGIKVYQKKLEDFDDILSTEKELLEIQVVESVGLKMIEEMNLFGLLTISSPVNLNSDQQVAKIIEETIGIKLPKTEPSDRFPEGQPSTASEVLKPLKGKHPFFELFLKYRKVEKLLNTFILPLYDKIDKDRRLRTSFNDCVPRTGRLSSSGPNLQNIPKELDESDIVNIRELFIADKGKVFIRADYDSQELRQLANVTMDANLIDAFNTNKDLHLVTANGTMGLNISKEKLVKNHPEYEEIKKKYKKERHIGKNGINFPIVYGSTAYGIAKNNNVSEEEAQGWIDGFFTLYPDVLTTLKKCKKEVWANHSVKNYFGRKRRFGEITPKAVRQAFNFWIQGFCADLLRLTMNQLRECYLQHPEWQANLVLSVHDDVITECNRTYAKQVLKAKKEIMENAVDLPVKFLTDIKICKSYGK